MHFKFATALASVFLATTLLTACGQYGYGPEGCNTFDSPRDVMLCQIIYLPSEKLKPMLERANHNADQWGRVLHIACTENRIDIAAYALSKGANVNVLTDPDILGDGNRPSTPLHEAVKQNDPELVKLLLKYGPDPLIMDAGDRVFPSTQFIQMTPLQLAEATGSKKEIITLLSDYQTEYSAWANAKKLDTVAVYQAFLDTHPQSVLTGQAQKGLQQAQDKIAAAKQAELKKQTLQHRIEQQENKLPITVRRDKYMIIVVNFLKEQHYAEAIPYCEKLSELPLKTDPSLDYYYGEALMKTGQPVKALEKLYHYVNTQGSNAPLYVKALGMINEIEAGQ